MGLKAQWVASGLFRGARRGVGALVFAALMLALGGCGARPVKSVVEFGSATDSLGEGVAATARGSAALCEQKRELDLDSRVILGEIGAKEVLVSLNADGCKTFRETSEFYAKLAQQLGAFGLAMRTLALSGETDYTEQLTQIGGKAEAFGLEKAEQAKVDAAAGLSAKLLSWFTSGYAAKKIGIALEHSERDVVATLDLLLAVLTVYDVQLKGYQQLIQQTSQEPEFDLPRENEATTAREARKSAQIELVKRHASIAAERKELLEASRASIEAVKALHADLVNEAKRKTEEFDIELLLSKARLLAGEVAEFRRLATPLVN